MGWGWDSRHFWLTVEKHLKIASLQHHARNCQWKKLCSGADSATFHARDLFHQAVVPTSAAYLRDSLVTSFYTVLLETMRGMKYLLHTFVSARACPTR